VLPRGNRSTFVLGDRLVGDRSVEDRFVVCQSNFALRRHRIRTTDRQRERRRRCRSPRSRDHPSRSLVLFAATSGDHLRRDQQRGHARVRSVKRLLAIVEPYQPTRREWGAIAIEAARRAGLEEPDVASLRLNLENQWVIDPIADHARRRR
jgi:hypothetical protein